MRQSKRSFIYFLVYTLISLELFGQEKIELNEPIELYRLEKNIRVGNKDSLFRLFEFLNDTTHIIDYLGYHRIVTTKGDVAYRILFENTFLLDSEINLRDSNVQLNFYSKLKTLYNQIYFDKSIDAFIITPLEKRTPKVEVKATPKSKLDELEKFKDSILFKSWGANIQIVEAIKKHDSRAMLLIAKEMLKKRDRYNEYDFEKEKYLNSISLLTGIMIGVENENGKITYQLEDFEIESQLHYAAYWVNNFRDFQWNDKKQLFQNLKQKVFNFPDEYNLFMQLENKNDSTAIGAFIKLTELAPEALTALDREFRYTQREFGAKSSFQDKKTLMVLAELTQFCKRNELDFKGSAKIQNDINLLKKEKLPFKVIYQKENELINQITFWETTALEYWASIYDSWHLGESVGRILDVYYTQNWESISRDSTKLKLYLKKAVLYDNIGTRGICHEYLSKFISLSGETRMILKSLQVSIEDIDIKEAATAVLSGSYFDKFEQEKVLDQKRIAEYKSGDTTWPHNLRIAPLIQNLEDTLSCLFNRSRKNNQVKDTILEVCALSVYEQIPIAIKYLTKISSDPNNKFWYENKLIKTHFGIPVDWIDSERKLSVFLENYKTKSELDLYKYYLKESGIIIYLPNDSLDYKRIYDILKFDMVVPFMGYGGLERQTGVFAITKILEQNFDTSLGLPRKNEHSVGFSINHSFTDDRREKWMKFLVDNKLVKEDKSPRSFFDYKN